MKIKNLIILLNILFIKNIYSAETYVYCSTADKKWDWLKINDKYVTINGEWEKTTIEIDTVAYISFFKINDERYNLKNLEKECVNQFGPSYIFAQPANNKIYNNWNVFGENKTNLGRGNVSYCYNDINFRGLHRCYEALLSRR